MRSDDFEGVGQGTGLCYFSDTMTIPQAFTKVLRAPVCKNQTKSKFRGKGGKFDFFHILMLDRLGYN